MATITGTKAVGSRLARMSGKEKAALVGQALFAGGEEIKAHAQHLITENAVSGKGHVPSKPGEPPNEDTGGLRNGIRAEQPAPLRVLVTSNAKHAVPLERGTSKMAARPYMGPAARAKRKAVVDRVTKVIDLVTAKKG